MRKTYALFTLSLGLALGLSGIGLKTQAAAPAPAAPGANPPAPGGNPPSEPGANPTPGPPDPSEVLPGDAPATGDAGDGSAGDGSAGDGSAGDAPPDATPGDARVPGDADASPADDAMDGTPAPPANDDGRDPGMVDDGLGTGDGASVDDVMSLPSNPSTNRARRRRALAKFGDSYFQQSRDRITALRRQALNPPRGTRGAPTVSPLTNIVGPNVSEPVPERYVLGPGDVLTFRYWNAVTPAREQELRVSPTGVINLPMGGRTVVLRGQSLDAAESLLRRELSRVLRDPQVTLTLKQLRSITVTLIGESFAPGSYQMPSTVTLFNALYLTGGPNTRGSLRNIQLKRPGGGTRIFDLYQFLLHADSSQDVPLRSGDLIFIPPARTNVTVTGEVFRPAVYELLAGNTLRDALRFAGGVRPSGVTQRIAVESVRPGMARRLIDVNLLTQGGGGDVTLYDGDQVAVYGIRPLIENAVTLEGAVDQPSQYALAPDMTVADLIERARGLLSTAFTERADLFRLRPNGSRELIPVNLAGALRRDPRQNLPLQSNDRVVVYDVNNIQFVGNHRVQVVGAVRKPGNYTRAEGMRISDLLLQTGGLNPDAFTERAFLQRRNPDGSYGPLQTVNLDRAVQGDGSDNLLLADRDVLTVLTLAQANFQPKQVVEITGAVQKPGNYPRSSNLTLTDLVRLAGGLLPTAAPERVFIQRKAEDGTVGPLLIVDLRQALDGDKRQDVEIQDGDRIIIHTKEQARYALDQTVSIYGAVQRPGTYARSKNMSLRDLIMMAGGPLPNASDRVEITKGVALKTERPAFISLEQALNGDGSQNPALEDESVVSIPQRTDIRLGVTMVTLKGAVRQPGTYTLTEGERLSSVIERAGGLTTDAFPEGAQFFRKPDLLTTTAQRDVIPDLAAIVSTVNEQEYRRSTALADIQRIQATTPQAGTNSNNTAAPTIASVLGNGGVNSTAATTAATALPSPDDTTRPDSQSLVTAARTLTEEDWMPRGNMNVSLADGMRNPGGKYDIAMQPGDVVNIPVKPTTVSVVGAVAHPSSVFFEPGQGIQYYVDQSGGFLEDAAMDRIMIIRANGMLVWAKSVRRLERGDVIFVPTKVMAAKLKDKKLATDQALNRLSGTAITIAVLKSLLF